MRFESRLRDWIYSEETSSRTTSSDLMKGPVVGCCIIHALHMNPPRDDKRKALNLLMKAELA